MIKQGRWIGLTNIVHRRKEIFKARQGPTGETLDPLHLTAFCFESHAGEKTEGE